MKIPFIVLLYKVIQLSIHLGYPDFAKNADIALLICFIATFLTFFYLHVQSPPLNKNFSLIDFSIMVFFNADSMPIYFSYNILLFNKIYYIAL